MTKNPPNRRGIVFEVGAQLEARDRLKKWYAALIEEINFEEGKVLIHFKHWNHRHDEWFYWDSPDLRPEEKIQLRKEGLHEQPVQPEFRVNQQVLACWSDCRFYPAKVTAVNKDGTYIVKFFDGIVQTVKNIHIKSFSKEQNVTCTKAKERNKEITSLVEKLKEKSNQQRSPPEHVKKEKELSQNVDEKQDLNKDELAVLSERVKLEHDEDNLISTSEESKKIAEKYKLLSISEESRADIEKDKLVVISKQSKLECDKDNLIAIFNESKGNPDSHTLFCSPEKSKLSEIHLPKNEKEDKENISENDKETLVNKPVEEKKNENSKKTQNRFSGRKRSKPNSLPSSEQSSQMLQPIILELRRRKISIEVGVQSKRPRLGKCMQKPAKSADLEQSPEKLKNLMNASEKSKVPRRSSRLSSSGLQETDVAPDPIVAECLKEKPTTPNEAPQHDLLSNQSKKLSMPSHGFPNEDKLNKVSDNRKGSQTPRRSSRLSSSVFQEIDLVHVTPTPVVTESLKAQDLCPMELVEGELQSNCSSEKIIKLVQFEENLNNSSGKSEEINITQSIELASNECREMLDIADVAPTPSLVEPLNEQAFYPKDRPDGDLLSVCPMENTTKSDCNVQTEEMLNSLDNCEIIQSMRRSPRLSPSRCPEMIDIINVIPDSAVAEPSREEASGPKVLPEVILENSCVQCPSLETNELVISEDASAVAAVEIGSTAAEEKAERIDLLKPADIKELAALPADAVLKKSNECMASKVLSNELDHIKFKCKFKDCSKFFRKAKLLHYHMKYFHGVDKTEKAQKQVTRTIQTRGSLANEKANLEIPKRRRTTSGSMHTPLRLELRNAHSNDKTEKRRHSVPSSSTLNIQRPMQREKRREPHVNKFHRKPQEMEKQNDNGTKEKEKCKEKKLKDFLRLKLKKKKKKKKKSKSECSASEENIEIAQELSPKKSQVSIKSSYIHKAPYCHESTPLQKSDLGDQVKKNEEDTLSDSSTDSLLWSEEEYSQEIDVTTNPEEILDDDEHDYEIVRCMCEVQEENDFMIQCEECLCWQHGVCMGLLEDNVPTKYTCFICRKPPGQRSGLKYWYDKGWLNNGHLHGLSFLEENYSHQNAKKIVATHQLLADVHRVIELLHGLQLKMSILQSKDHPDLKLWCLPWKQHSMNDKCYPKQSFHTANCCKDEAKYRTFNGAVEKSSIPSVEESYITSEHCYQKPRAYYPAIEQRLVVETRGSAVDDGVNRRRENGEDALTGRMGWQVDIDKSIMESDSKHNYCKVRECVPKKCSSEDALEMKLMDSNCDSVLNTQLQWQLNLLSHVESLQDEVTHRMDFIEKELDVLESFLDYTGELEPPEPLARLPQLKHRIKQLLMDLGKVQQIAVCCSTCI